MKVDGGCLCGHITYEAEVDPQSATICHCTDCQTHTGAAYGVVVRIVEDGFDLLGGELKFFEKIADSGNTRALAFCPECGTRIYARTVGEGLSFFGLRLGTVRQREHLPPKRQIWCRSAQGWVMDLGAIPKFDLQPTAAELSPPGDG